MSQYISKFGNWVNRGHWSIIAVAFIAVLALTGWFFGMAIAAMVYLDRFVEMLG